MSANARRRLQVEPLMTKYYSKTQLLKVSVVLHRYMNEVNQVQNYHNIHAHDDCL